MAVGVAAIPDVVGVMGFVASAVVAFFIAELVDLAGSEAGADGDTTKGGLQRFDEVSAKLGACRDLQIWVIGNVRHAVEICHLAVEKVAQEKIF